ncbi:MAG TPA: serine/threonine-protein kinase [Polyangiaceae bacterium]|nr:serine/threonine-protein kinase [Polyangiaceae bacterium]
MDSDTRALEPAAEPRAPQAVGRYWVYDEIAAGGMATVHLGRLVGPAGFTRTVAIKKLHPQFAKDDEFSSMFLDEARIAARIRHPNALTALDVVASKGELYIVMDYIHGESLGKLLRGGPIPLAVASSVNTQALLGLHAAHEAVDDHGKPLDIVHRDVSPQNILVGVDGVARVVDFGIAKAASRVHTTQAGKIKGKLSYMSPQQVQSEDVDRRADIFAAGVVLWESVVGRKLLARGDATINRVTTWQGIPDEDLALVPAFLQPIVKRALARDPGERYATAREMALALADAVPPASSMEVGDWVEQRARQVLADRARAVSDVERQTTSSDVRPAFSSGFPSSGEETRTALSSTDLVPSSRSEPKKRKRAAAMVAGAAALLLLLGWMLEHRGATPPPTAALAAAPAPPAPVAPPPPAVAPAAAAPVSPATLAPEPTPAPSAAPTHAKRAAASNTTAKVAAAPAAKKNCTPPFDIGKDGIKHFKPECFK